MTSTYKVSGLPNRYSWLAWGVGISIALGQPLASAKSPTGKVSKAGQRNTTTLTKQNTTSAADAYNKSGNQKYDRGNYQGALADYNKAISLDPKSAKSYNNRGTLKHEKLNDVQGALADYNKAISLNPKFANAYNNRGLLKYQLNNAQEALADYDRAISLNPKFALAYYNRGLLKRDENNPAGANRDFNVSAKLYRQQGNKNDLKAVNEAIARLNQQQQNNNSDDDDNGGGLTFPFPFMPGY
jgi:tetratricopeptide (TPR) repeat protein